MDVYPPPSLTALVFSIMMECTPESGGCTPCVRYGQIILLRILDSIPFRASEWVLPRNSECLGMSTFFRGMTETVPSLFRGIFPERNSVPNPTYRPASLHRLETYPSCARIYRPMPEFIDPVLAVKMIVFAKLSPKRSFSFQSVLRDTGLRLFWMRSN
jgi:hypothetical protein